MVIVGNCKLLAHAEVGEDVVEGFLRGDLAAGDFGEDVESLAEVFGEEVTAQFVVETFDDAPDAVVGTEESIVVAGVGDYDVGVGECGGSGDELLLEHVEPDAIFGLESLGLVLDADDGLVIAETDIGVGDAWLGHHEDDAGALGSSHRAFDAQLLDGVRGVADASGVDESKGNASEIDGVLNGIAGGALNLADDGPFFAKQGVKEC